MTKKSSYEGKIISHVDRSTNSNDKTCWKFTLKDGNERIDCIVWGNYVDTECRLTALETGKILLVRGFWGNPKEGSLNGPEFIVKWFGEPDAPEVTNQTWNERVYEYYGGKDKYDKRTQELHEYMEGKGFCWAYFGNELYGWAKQADCVRYRGEYWHRMEYLCEVLGPDVVRDSLVKVAPDGQISGLVGLMKRKPEEYQKILSGLLCEAKAREEYLRGNAPSFN